MNEQDIFDQPAWIQPRTAYIHIPFCQHHCGYCDFAVTTGQDHLIDQYLDALEVELQQLQTPRRVETLFIGGGTPTYLNVTQLETLLKSLNFWLPPSSQAWLEATIESTPESLSPDKVQVLATYGINRISIGVQSFQSKTLKHLDRLHRADMIEDVINFTRRFIPNISLDLIFAAPGQSLHDWQRDLERAIQFDIPHLSLYGLTYEKGTPLWKSRERGIIIPLTEICELEMYQMAQNLLPISGYEHYEISNFAKPGFESRHNHRYWANEAYYGFGVGAARYINGIRSMNTRSTKQYIERILSDGDATFQHEKLEPIARAYETLATQLRRRMGVNRQSFHSQTSFELDHLIGDVRMMLLQEGLILDDGRSVYLSQSGQCVADSVIEQILKSCRG